MPLPLTRAQQLSASYSGLLNDPRVTLAPEQLTAIANEVTMALNSAKGADVGVLYSLLGHVRHHQGRLEEALKHAQRALKADAQDPNLANGVSRAYGDLGQHEEALHYAEMADRLLKDRPDATVELVVVLNQLAARMERGGSGIDDLVRRAVKLVEVMPVKALRAAWTLSAAGRWREAMECIAAYIVHRLQEERGERSAREVIATAPAKLLEEVRSFPSLANVIDEAPKWLDMPEPLTALIDEAQRAVDEGRREDAHRALRRTAAAAGTNVPALRALSSMMARLGHENDAVEFLARAVVVVEGAPRGRRLAVQVTLDAPEWTSRMIPDDSVLAALAAVRKRHGAPMPTHLAVSAEVELSEEGWRRFAELVAP